jgi:hypothetical protein
MIRHFEPSPATEPEDKNHLQWLPAVNAGLIAGGILLVVPRGNPWSALDFFAPVVMGRIFPESWSVPLIACFVMHLGLSVLYSLIISRVVVGVTQLRAVITGGIVGLFLYLLNLGAVTFAAPGLRGNEVSVAFTHLVFGLIAGGAYRGLLRRRPAVATVTPEASSAP